MLRTKSLLPCLLHYMHYLLFPEDQLLPAVESEYVFHGTPALVNDFASCTESHSYLNYIIPV